MFDDLRIDPSIPLQQPEHHTFASRASTPAPLASPTEIGFIQLNLTGEFTGHALQFRHVKQRRTQFLIDPTDDFGIDSQVMRQSIGWHLLIEPLQNGNLSPEFCETLLPSTGAAVDIPAARPIDPKRPAEHTLAATQKVGRTPENPMRSRNHAASSLPDGYETP
jgi:hypothetical protein